MNPGAAKRGTIAVAVANRNELSLTMNSGAAKRGTEQLQIGDFDNGDDNDDERRDGFSTTGRFWLIYNSVLPSLNGYPIRNHSVKGGTPKFPLEGVDSAPRSPTDKEVWRCHTRTL